MSRMYWNCINLRLQGKNDFRGVWRVGVGDNPALVLSGGRDQPFWGSDMSEKAGKVGEAGPGIVWAPRCQNPGSIPGASLLIARILDPPLGPLVARILDPPLGSPHCQNHGSTPGAPHCQNPGSTLNAVKNYHVQPSMPGY